MVTAKELVKKWQEVGTSKIKSTKIYKKAVNQPTKAEVRKSSNGSGGSSDSASVIKAIEQPTKAEVRKNIGYSNVSGYSASQLAVQDNWNKGGWFRRRYIEAEVGLQNMFGFTLPGGITRDMAKAVNADVSAYGSELATKAEKRKRKAEQELDFETDSWYENIPLVPDDVNPFVDDGEVEYRDRETIIEITKLIREQDKDLKNIGKDSNFGFTPETSSKDTGTNLGIAVAVGIGFLIFSGGFK